jgi:hypothetical protein
MRITNIIPLFLFLGLSKAAWSQNAAPHSWNRMQQRADSVSKFTDSLISFNSLLQIVCKSNFKGDTTSYYRQYFIDTASGYLVKCIVDTTFEDYFTRRFHQVVIYFNQGYEFKNCYALEKDVPSLLCTYYNIYPEKYEVKQQLGKLRNGWTREELDAQIRDHIQKEIFQAKFSQKKYHGQ